jgi:hypothetical protein
LKSGISDLPELLTAAGDIDEKENILEGYAETTFDFFWNLSIGIDWQEKLSVTQRKVYP